MSAFTNGDFVVVRVGNGGTTALSSTAAPVFLDEYSAGGTLVQTIPLPTAASGANHQFVDSGSATSEGILNLSGDGHYLLLGGFDAAVGTATVASSAATTGRIVARVGFDGTVDTTTSLPIANDERSVASADGSSYYVGTNSNAYYATEGGTTATSLGALNSRDIELYGTQLYYDTGTTVGKLGAAGTTAPTSGTQTPAPFTFSTAPGSNLGDFFLADLDGTPGLDTLYIVDGTNGLEKFSLVGTNWVLNSKIATVGATAVSGLEGLTATVSGTTVSLYVSSPTRVLSFTDTAGYNAAASATTLTSVVDHTNATSFPNQAIRGVSFAPTSGVAAPTLTIDSPSVMEGDSATTTLTYTVKLNAAATSAVTFHYATADGTATAGSDYVATSGDITIPVGGTSATIAVTVNGDTMIEPNETVLLNLSNPVNATLATTQGTGTITNDDFPGTFALAGNQSANEDAGAQVFTVNRTGGTAGAATISYAVTGTGTHPADATDFGGTLPSGTVTFADGQASQTISIPVHADTTVEPDETYALTLSNPTAGSLGTATATGTIVNDDLPGTFALAGDVSQSEAAGAQVFTINRTGGTAGPSTISYAVTGTGAHPADATDFGGALPSGTVTFADGQATATVSVGVTNDTTFETDETYTLTLSGPTAGTLGQATATGTIVNDDPAPPVGAFSLAGDASAAEAVGGIAFTVNRTGGSTGTATVDYAVTGSGTHPADATDFGGALPHGTVTFMDGQTSATVTVPVSDDHTVEPDETFTLALTNPTAGATLGTATTATGTILNDDVAGTFSLAGDKSANEDAGAQVFTINRTGGTADAATISYAVTGSGAHPADANDFTGHALPSGTVTFADGETSHTISIPVSADTTFEPDETYTLTLTGTTGGTIGTATATGTIVNDDPVPPTLSIGDASVIEGDSGTSMLTFTVTASAAAPAGGISFGIATADGTATARSDYVAQTTTGTIAAGATTTTFTVLVNGDTTYERNETLTVNLSNPVNATIAHGQAIGTIENDDPTPATMQIFSTDFGSFTAAGFSPGATATSGMLDSNIWRVAGLSDNTNPSYGFTGPAGGDFGRGIINGSADPVTAGVYSPSADHALVIQPTGAELDANGTVEARIQNTSGATATTFDLAFDWAYRNSGGRSDNLQLAYSTDGTNYTTATAANFSTPAAADATVASTFTDQHESLGITGTVADGGYLYLRWIHASSTGGGSRDEVGIDNVNVTAHLSSTPTASVADISFAEGNSGTTNATFTISRSSGTAAGSVDYATADGTAVAGSDYVAQHGTVNFAVGQLTQTVTVLVNGDTAHEADETFTLNPSNATGFQVPQPVATATITNDDTGPVAIYDIQGLGQRSQFTSQSVSTSGVVTAVKSTGFYLQDPNGDGNIGTSDAIFVATGTAPTVVVGNAITLTGTVAEVSTAANLLSITELTNPTAIVVTSMSVPLPAAVIIATDGTGRAPPTSVIDNDNFHTYDPVHNGIDFYESLEGMRVTIKQPLVVANTDATGETFVVASNGVGATGLNDRDGMTISAGDNNPETIKIYEGSAAAGAHSQGDVLGDVTGVVNYFGGRYEVDPTTAVTVATDNPPLAREATTLTGDADHLSYASFNLENFSPRDQDTTAPSAAIKIDRLTTEIITALHSPNVIGLQEVQDADGQGTGTDLSGVANVQRLIDAVAAAGGPVYKYIEIAPTATNISGGAPDGNIRNGFLYDPSKVSYVEGSLTVLTDAAFNGTRKPLVADFSFNGQTFTAIDTHSTSRGGSDPLFGSDQPPVAAGDAARTAQATAIKSYIDNVLGTDAGHKFVVNGDFNGFPYENALQTITASGTIDNLYDKLPAQERYSYYFDGYYQAFDNILVSDSLNANSTFDVIHYNAGFTDNYSVTDHDQVLAEIGLARSTGAATAVADRYGDTAAAVLHGTVLANDTGGSGSTLSVTLVDGAAANVGTAYHLASGASLTLLADGTFSYDPDGAFSGLAAGATATDGFSYSLANGSTATATVTITGIAATPAADANGHIDGTAGNDVYGGTSGADYFDLSSGGNDTVDTGAGDDAIFLGAALTAADHINGGSGNDQVGIKGDYTGTNALVLSATTLTNIETLALLPGGSTPHSYVITSNDATVAAGQTFTVYASQLAAGENVTFDGSAETDGSFVFFGGAGIDTFTGGAKDDAFYFGPDKFGPNDIVHGGAGTDQLGLDGHSAALTLDSTHTDVEILALLHGPNDMPADTYGTITVDSSWLIAGQTKIITANTMYQSSTMPVSTSLTIDGSHVTAGNLSIFGGTAGDTIIGGSGNDHIYGGLGADTLTGGGGADVFMYNAPAESTGTTFDTLTDFTFGSATASQNDTLSISGQGADNYVVLSGGQLNTATFEADLQAAVGTQLSGGHAVFFTATTGDLANQTFLLVDSNNTAGYQTGGDYVFHVSAAPAAMTGAADFITG